MLEVCLNIEPFMQPSPARNEKGDCFACALTAAMRHLFPEQQVEFSDCWEMFLSDTGRLNNTWPGIRSALYKAYSRYGRLEVTNDMVEPRFNPDVWSHAWWQQFPCQRVAHRLEGWMRGGWIVFADISYDGTGPYNNDTHTINITDHFVLIDGVKGYWKPFEDGQGAVYTNEIHVVCSVKGAYWVELGQFLRRHGSTAWWLCRKDIRS